MIIPSLEELSPERFETAAILKRVTSASRQLAELKGASTSIPDQAVLINGLGLQEAKDSSAIENIVTTHDDLFRDSLFPEDEGNPSAKEVLRYRQALDVGFAAVSATGYLSNNHILSIRAELERNDAGYRKLPGTELRDQDGRVVYTPPDPTEIIPLMSALERFINNEVSFPADPLVKMTLIHHQFESIHPFYDGNGRTGRIMNVLYLVKEGLLDIPILYMSRHIIRTKTDYYRLLGAARTRDAWEEWVIFLLTAVEEAAREGITTVCQIKNALVDTRHHIRDGYKFYSQDLINALFTQPFTGIQKIAGELGVSRLTATKYLDALTAGGILEKRRVGRSSVYVNRRLYAILTGAPMQGPA